MTKCNQAPHSLVPPGIIKSFRSIVDTEAVTIPSSHKPSKAGEAHVVDVVVMVHNNDDENDSASPQGIPGFQQRTSPQNSHLS